MNDKPLKNIGLVKRKAVGLSASELVTVEPEAFGGGLPLLVRPAADGLSLAAWAGEARPFLDEKLLRHGAILLRGFPVPTRQEFHQFIDAVSAGALEYRERSSPRSHVGDHIYTSTDYPQAQTIFMHNENSYATTWPLHIFFYCDSEPLTGGETPLADTRGLFRRLDPAMVRRFIEKKVLYVRNYSEGLGLTWQTVFQTEDRREVEAYCRTSGYEWEWRSGDRLRTRRVGQAVARHPRSGDLLWFNHAAFFHVTTLEKSIREALLAQFPEEDLPNNTCYGDGTPIEPSVLDAIRDAYLRETVAFPWRHGDVLMVDNMLTAHGRKPYTGPRRILVGMSEPVDSQDPGHRVDA